MERTYTDELRDFYHEVINGHRKVLIVGGMGSGKTELIKHLMAYGEDGIEFEKQVKYWDYDYWKIYGRSSKIELDAFDIDIVGIVDVEIDLEEYVDQVKNYPGTLIITSQKDVMQYSHFFDYVIEMKENFSYEIVKIRKGA